MQSLVVAKASRSAVRRVAMMSPIGELALTAGDDGLLEVRLPAPEDPLPTQSAAPAPGSPLPPADVPSPVTQEVSAPVAEGAPAFVTPPRGPRLSADAILTAARRQLDEYFAGRRRTFVLPLSLAGTEFECRVWAALSEVGYGATVTYGQLARAIGEPRAARAVGTALGRNPLAVVLPCHRVVAAGGGLGGFAGGLARKRLLLDRESGAGALSLLVRAG